MAPEIIVAIPIFERLTALDAVGPYEVLQRVPGVRVKFIGKQRGAVRTENGMLGLVVDATYAEVPSPNIIVFPGGMGTRTLINDEEILAWVRKAHETTRFTTSVCTGALILGAAGLLRGLRATTYYSCYDYLVKFGAEPVKERWVQQGKIITAAGVSAGIDMALHLAAQLSDEVTAQAQQLSIEYDPHPPFDAGSLDKASPAVKARAKEIGEMENSGEVYMEVLASLL